MMRPFTVRAMSLMAVVALAACDSTFEPPLGLPAVTLDAVGDAVQLVATGAGDALPYWESLDTTVVTVTPAGMAVAVGAGTAVVRARLGSRDAEGPVTVLPPVDVRISSVQVVTDPDGLKGLSMQVSNTGGRGYYRFQYWKEPAEGETEPRLIMYSWSDNEAGPALSYGFTDWALPEIPDWIVVYSREPKSLGYEMTACVRVASGASCLPQ